MLSQQHAGRRPPRHRCSLRSPTRPVGAPPATGARSRLVDIWVNFCWQAEVSTPEYVTLGHGDQSQSARRVSGVPERRNHARPASVALDRIGRMDVYGDRGCRAGASGCDGRPHSRRVRRIRSRTRAVEPTSAAGPAAETTRSAPRPLPPRLRPSPVCLDTRWERSRRRPGCRRSKGWRGSHGPRWLVDKT
jgi:hypothetical protein